MHVCAGTCLRRVCMRVFECICVWICVMYMYMCHLGLHFPSLPSFSLCLGVESTIFSSLSTVRRDCSFFFFERIHQFPRARVWCTARPEGGITSPVGSLRWVKTGHPETPVPWKRLLPWTGLSQLRPQFCFIPWASTPWGYPGVSPLGLASPFD